MGPLLVQELQEVAQDRQAVSTTISMPNTKLQNLTSPMKPTFAERQSCSDADSVNHAAVTDIVGG